MESKVKNNINGYYWYFKLIIKLISYFIYNVYIFFY